MAPKITDNLIADHLIYVSDTARGISRRPRGKTFTYIGPDDNPIVNASEIKRIDSLAIPPAYQKVWICPKPNGHIQATGYDEAGRKQYRYHPDWRAYRDIQKYAQLNDFGDALPRLRRKVRAIFKNGNARRPDKDMACAALIRLLDDAPLRIGNDRVGKTRGATTLVSSNAQISDDMLKLDYTAKGGKRVRRQIKDKSLMRILSAIDDLPGKALFQYFGHDDQIYPLDSHDVNQWLKDHSGNDQISAKVFRTWHGSTIALRYIRTEEKPTIKGACEQAAHVLRNTPAICRSSYIHPAIIDFVSANKDERRAIADDISPKNDIRIDEQILLKFLATQAKVRSSA